ncbi:MAG TPA: porin [Xanthobacteraceae bacterium]|nr:porin [Xanthobacteraceae bacterium]
MKPRIILATAAALAIVVSPGLAQTLTQPNPASETKTPPPAATTKSRQTGHVRTCDAYGAGFRNIPGTDACLKIGGGVTVDVGR